MSQAGRFLSRESERVLGPAARCAIPKMVASIAYDLNVPGSFGDETVRLQARELPQQQSLHMGFWRYLR
jgi:hypothetical protein